MVKTPQLQKLYDEEDKSKIVDHYIKALNDIEILIGTNNDLYSNYFKTLGLVFQNDH